MARQGRSVRMPASAAARPLYRVRYAGTPHGYVRGDGRVAASPRRPSRAGSRRATTLIAGRRPAACASTCPPARARPAPSTHCRRRSDPPCGGADPAGRTCRRPWRCVAGSVPPRAPVSLPASRRMPAVAVKPMRSTCRPAARRWGSFCPRRRARRSPGRRRKWWRRRRGSRARTAVTEHWQTRWAANGRLESAGQQQCGSRFTKLFSLCFSHLRRKEACRDGLE